MGELKGKSSFLETIFTRKCILLRDKPLKFALECSIKFIIPWLKSWLHYLQATWHWESYLTSLSLNFHMYEMGMIIVPTL